jgi:hypothetical protein
MDRIFKAGRGFSRRQLLRQRRHAVGSSINEVIIDAIGRELGNQDIEETCSSQGIIDSHSSCDAKRSVQEPASSEESDHNPNVDNVSNSVSDGNVQMDDSVAGCSAERVP